MLDAMATFAADWTNCVLAGKGLHPKINTLHGLTLSFCD
jgi:hypothetical protein